MPQCLPKLREQSERVIQQLLDDQIHILLSTQTGWGVSQLYRRLFG